jgi:hypothetical protein
MSKLIVLLAFVVVQNCSADMTVKEYLNHEKLYENHDSVLNGVYLNGVGHGFEWANDWLEKRHLPPMFCVPDSMPLNGYNYVQMVDHQIERLRQSMPEPDLDGMFVPLLLQKALIEAFPCPHAAPKKP